MGERVMVMDVPRKAEWWMDSIKHNLTERGLLGSDTRPGCLEATHPKHIKVGKDDDQ